MENKINKVPWLIKYYPCNILSTTLVNLEILRQKRIEEIYCDNKTKEFALENSMASALQKMNDTDDALITNTYGQQFKNLLNSKFIRIFTTHPSFQTRIENIEGKKQASTLRERVINWLCI